MTKCLLRRTTIVRGGLLGATMSIVMAGSAMAAPPAPAPPPPAPKAAPAQAATQQSLTATAVSVLSGQTATTDISSCGTPTISQPFLSWNDNNWYTLAPGESADNFDGTGWTLVNGANIQTTQLLDAQTGSVLDLPSGAEAISPPMCVDSDYPTARSMVRTTGGAQVEAGVFYAGADPKSQLQFSGAMQSAKSQFAASQPLQVHPGNAAGWQMVQFIFGTTGAGADGQIYNFYVDPRMCR